MRRLVVLSLLLVLGGLALVVPSSAFYNLLTTGSASGTTAAAFSRLSGTDNTTTIEEVVGTGMIIVGAVLEFLSLFTDVGANAPPTPMPLHPPAPPSNPPASEKKGTSQ